MLTNVLVVLNYVAKYVSMEEQLDPCWILAFAQPMSWSWSFFFFGGIGLGLGHGKPRGERWNAIKSPLSLSETSNSSLYFTSSSLLIFFPQSLKWIPISPTPNQLHKHQLPTLLHLRGNGPPVYVVVLKMWPTVRESSILYFFFIKKKKTLNRNI